MYKNPKVNAVLRTADTQKFLEQDYADLALAAADQAGLSVGDQSLFRALLMSTIDDAKNKRARYGES